MYKQCWPQAGASPGKVMTSDTCHSLDWAAVPQQKLVPLFLSVREAKALVKCLGGPMQYQPHAQLTRLDAAMACVRSDVLDITWAVPDTWQKVILRASFGLPTLGGWKEGQDDVCRATAKGCNAYHIFRQPCPCTLLLLRAVPEPAPHPNNAASRQHDVPWSLCQRPGLA